MQRAAGNGQRQQVTAAVYKLLILWCFCALFSVIHLFIEAFHALIEKSISDCVWRRFDNFISRSQRTHAAHLTQNTISIRIEMFAAFIQATLLHVRFLCVIFLFHFQFNIVFFFERARVRASIVERFAVTLHFYRINWDKSRIEM